MGKASRMKKSAGKVSGPDTAELEGGRAGLAAKAAPRSPVLIAALVAIVTFIIFLPALKNEFVNWDDDEYVYENPFIRSLDARLFKSAFLGFRAANWHPLTWISHAVDYALWGLNSAGHHLTNILLHALNTFMTVFLVARLLESSNKASTGDNRSAPFLNDRTILISAAATGLLFGLHPLHVESVAWVAERKDLLCALFFLLSLTMYVKYIGLLPGGPGQRVSAASFLTAPYLFAIGFFILSLLSKPMAVSLPLVLLILDWGLFRRIRSAGTFGTVLLEKLPFMALSLISAGLTLSAQKAGEAFQALEILPLSTRLLVAAKSLVAYLGKMMAPLHLSPFYPYPGPREVSLLSFEYFLPVVLLIGITAFCVVSARKRRLPLSVWAYFVITLLPVLGVVQVGRQSMADRYTYLPSLGPFLAAGLAAALMYEKAGSAKQRGLSLRIAGAAGIVAALAALSYATIQQIGVWKNGLVLWNYVIEQEPGRVPVAYNNLGNLYASKGRLDLAIQQYRTALRLKPDFAEAQNNLGLAYASQGRIDTAIAQYRAAIRLKPDYAGAYNNLGNIYSSQGRLDLAMQQYRTALRLKPDFAEAHYNLGFAYDSQGRIEPAIAQYRAAIKSKPDYAEAYNNLGNLYADKGRLDLAIQQYQAALRLRPDDAEAHFNLGVIYLKSGAIERARNEIELVLTMKAGDTDALRVLNTIDSMGQKAPLMRK